MVKIGPCIWEASNWDIGTIINDYGGILRAIVARAEPGTTHCRPYLRVWADPIAKAAIGNIGLEVYADTAANNLIHIIASGTANTAYTGCKSSRADIAASTVVINIRVSIKAYTTTICQCPTIVCAFTRRAYCRSAYRVFTNIAASATI